MCLSWFIKRWAALFRFRVNAIFRCIFWMESAASFFRCCEIGNDQIMWENWWINGHAYQSFQTMSSVSRAEQIDKNDCIVWWYSDFTESAIFDGVGEKKAKYLHPLIVQLKCCPWDLRYLVRTKIRAINWLCKHTCTHIHDLNVWDFISFQIFIVSATSKERCDMKTM